MAAGLASAHSAGPQRPAAPGLPAGKRRARARALQPPQSPPG